MFKQSDLDDKETLVSEHKHKGKTCSQSAAVFNVVNSIIGSGIIGKCCFVVVFLILSVKAKFKTLIMLLVFFEGFKVKILNDKLVIFFHESLPFFFQGSHGHYITPPFPEWLGGDPHSKFESILHMG